MGRAIGHLIDNAIAATPAGGRILVELSRHNPQGQAGKSDDRARIVVSDNGAGMDSAALARALSGIKVSADGKRVERRQGIGLPLARQIVEAHSGSLELISELGQGTTAIVDLP